eukprot:g2653.t1
MMIPRCAVMRAGLVHVNVSRRLFSARWGCATQRVSYLTNNVDRRHTTIGSASFSTDIMDKSVVRSDSLQESGAKSRVLVLYTGGTMGMTREHPGAPLKCSRGYLTERLKNEILTQEGMPDCDVKEYDTLVDSSLITPERWREFAIDIEKNYVKFDGFVVIHGTDTMAYTASALSFMLRNLGKPVILTGSNIPMCDAINDAARNLTVAILYAASLDVPEVCIFFNNILLRGNRTTKLDINGLNAFESPNYSPLATLKVHTELRKEKILRFPRGILRVRTEMDENVVCVKLVPGFQDRALKAMIRGGDLRGLVLEFYGSGTGLAGKPGLIEAVKLAVDQGIVVVAATQCLKGTVDLGAYEAGISSADVNVVSSSDMTTEATVTKLSYLLGAGLPVDRVKELMGVSLCGELTPLDEYKRISLAPRSEFRAGWTYG